jgi:tRNA threonylcarbamoyladenosine biosynthesis protein TsaB
MNILSFDTTNNLASVAITHNNKILSYNSTKQNSQQAEKLFNLIDQCLNEAKLSLTDIHLVSVTNGPGSFTGVRIGLSSALGMRLGCDAQFIALTNFQILAYKARIHSLPIAVILDARRDQLYFQAFNEKLEFLDEPKLIHIKDLELSKNTILIGDGCKFLPQNKNHINLSIDARLLAQASEFFWQRRQYYDLIPLYIREPDISLPKR